MITKELSTSRIFKKTAPILLGGKASVGKRPKLTSVAQLACKLVMIGGLFLFAYGAVWNFSTRKYLRGFADAIIPLDGSQQEKTEALVGWFRHEPHRMDTLGFRPEGLINDRDPVNIVQNGRLLKVCGTATNAFMNLADASGIPVRRLLLIDTSGNTMHVVAEVQWGSRWIVVDPSNGIVFKDKLGRALTRQDLRDPQVFRDAISRAPDYNPTYTFDHTIHIRLERIPILGGPLRRLLNHIDPKWEEFINWSYFPENPALWLIVISLPFFLLGLLGILYTNRRGRHKRDDYNVEPVN